MFTTISFLWIWLLGAPLAYAIFDLMRTPGPSATSQTAFSGRVMPHPESTGRVGGVHADSHADQSGRLVGHPEPTGRLTPRT